MERIRLIQLILGFTEEVFKFFIVLNQFLLFVTLEFAIFLLIKLNSMVVKKRRVELIANLVKF